MTMASRSAASRIAEILLACLAGISGFFAFNVVDGVFGVAKAIIGIAACVAATVFVFRRAPAPEEGTDV